MLSGCCALWKRKRKKNHLCWTVEVKLVLPSRVRVWEMIIFWGRNLLHQLVHLLHPSLHLERLLWQNLKVLKFNWHKRTNQHLLNRKGSIHLPNHISSFLEGAGYCNPNITYIILEYVIRVKPFLMKRNAGYAIYIHTSHSLFGSVVLQTSQHVHL